MGDHAGLPRILGEALLAPLDLLPADLALLAAALATGAIAFAAIAVASPGPARARARDRMLSAVYEARLYLDSPRRLLAAAARLLAWSVVYLATLLPAMALLAPLLLLLGPGLAIRHARAPLPVGRPIVVRVELSGGADPEALRVEPTPAVRVTAPLLVVADARLAYLRIQVDRPGEHELRLRLGGRTVAKRLSADPRRVASPERRAGVAAAWALGREAAIPTGAGIDRIRVTHAARAPAPLGLRAPWWLLWLAPATLAALALGRWKGVPL